MVAISDHVVAASCRSHAETPRRSASQSGTLRAVGRDSRQTSVLENGNTGERLNFQVSSNMELRWLVSFPASCLHAAEAISCGQLIADQRLAEAITEPAQELRRSIVSAGLPRAAFWRQLVGLAASIDNHRQLAELAIRKTMGPATRNAFIASDLAGHIAAIESAVRRAFPDMVEELTLRCRPMREQWEARGPGLLRSMARWTDAKLIAPRADVVLVYPALGGGGVHTWLITAYASRPC